MVANWLVQLLPCYESLLVWILQKVIIFFSSVPLHLFRRSPANQFFSTIFMMQGFMVLSLIWTASSTQASTLQSPTNYFWSSPWLIRPGSVSLRAGSQSPWCYLAAPTCSFVLPGAFSTDDLESNWYPKLWVWFMEPYDEPVEVWVWEGLWWLNWLINQYGMIFQTVPKCLLTAS